MNNEGDDAATQRIQNQIGAFVLQIIQLQIDNEALKKALATQAEKPLNE